MAYIFSIFLIYVAMGRNDNELMIAAGVFAIAGAIACADFGGKK